LTREVDRIHRRVHHLVANNPVFQHLRPRVRVRDQRKLAGRIRWSGDSVRDVGDPLAISRPNW
jgi:hypothetical protein